MHRDRTTCRHGVSTCELERLAVALSSPPTAADERYFGTDLATLSNHAIRCERALLRHSILFSDRPLPWAAERLRRIERELAARRARGPSRTATGGAG